MRAAEPKNTAAIRQKLPFLIDLTKDARQALPKLGRRQKPGFSQKGFGRGVPKPWMLPVSFDLNQMGNSAELLASLSSLSLALGQLHKQVDDTAMQVGSQAYQPVAEGRILKSELRILRDQESGPKATGKGSAHSDAPLRPLINASMTIK